MSTCCRTQAYNLHPRYFDPTRTLERLRQKALLREPQAAFAARVQVDTRAHCSSDYQTASIKVVISLPVRSPALCQAVAELTTGRFS